MVLHWTKMMRPLRGVAMVAFAFSLAGTAAVCGQADLPIYTDHLVNGFQDWSWTPRSLTNTAPVHTGANSIRVNAAAWQGLGFYHPEFDSTLYSALNFWVNGGTGGGQVIQVQARLSGVNQVARVLPALAPNTWQQLTLSLASLGIESKTNVTEFLIQLTGTGTANPFYVDDIQLIAKPLPAVVHVTVDAARPVRSVDARWFGVNTAVWDGNYAKPETTSLLEEMGALVLRFPGGSLSDEYHWASNQSGSNTWTWATSFDKFAPVATNLGAQVYITVNYGSGTPEEAAGWVRYSNLTKHYGFKYWEIGNENFGSWETDNNVYPHDAYTYAVRAAVYYQQMKAADPTIKIGVVGTPGETNFDNGYSAHPAFNQRTGKSSNGWTPVVLATLKSLGVTPDFLIHHQYPEWTFSESDPLLLQTSTSWAREAADLRQQISDYFGAGGEGIELVCTENNSNSGNQGKQSTGLVNGLYLADSLGQLMKTEFNAYVWWDLRNSTDTRGNMDSTLYGWRSYGDLGMVNGLTNRHPTFYTAKLLQYFARPGDTVLSTSSDHLLLSAYAVRHTNGALGLMVINKNPAGPIASRIALNGFTPDPSAQVWSYGIPQDEAARLRVGSPDIAQAVYAPVSSAFDLGFPPYSVTVFNLVPTAPTLTAHLAASTSPGQITLLLQGQPGASYVLETSSKCMSGWVPVSTNFLSEPTCTLTETLKPEVGGQYWRAVWVP
jgi:alpha-L-arabinofuranosidase